MCVCVCGSECIEFNITTYTLYVISVVLTRDARIPKFLSPHRWADFDQRNVNASKVVGYIGSTVSRRMQCIPPRLIYWS